MVLAGPTEATVGPVSYRALAATRQVMAIKAVTHYRGAAGRTDASPVRALGARPQGSERDGEPRAPPLAPSVGHVPGPSPLTLRGCSIDVFIVSRGASFINTCTDTILERVMACGGDSAVTSGTLLPLFASS